MDQMNVTKILKLQLRRVLYFYIIQDSLGNLISIPVTQLGYLFQKKA